MSEYTRNMYGFRTYEETPKFYISDLRPWPNAVHIFKGHSGDVMEYVPAHENDRLREVIAEQEQTIEYLHERCKAEEVENHKLRGLALILLNCAGNVDRCDNCPLNGNPYDVAVCDWFACDTLYDMVKEMGLL